MVSVLIALAVVLLWLPAWAQIELGGGRGAVSSTASGTDAAAVSTSGPISATTEYATTGSGGITRTLPAAASGTTIREFWILKVDAGAGALTLAPNGTNTLNDSTTPLSTSTQWTGFHVKELSATGWYVESLVKLVNLTSDVTGILNGPNGGTGLNTTGLSGVPMLTGGAWSVTTTPRGPGGGFCAATGGDGNDSATGSGTFKAHALTCTIPANTLVANRIAEVCVGWNTTTGSTAPTLITQVKAGATVLYLPLQTASQTNSRTNLGNSWCVRLMAAADPGASVNVYTNLIFGPTFETSGPYANTIAQPVLLATNANLVLSFETKWNTAGTGTTVITQTTLTGRFLN